MSKGRGCIVYGSGDGEWRQKRNDASRAGSGHERQRSAPNAAHRILQRQGGRELTTKRTGKGDISLDRSPDILDSQDPGSGYVRDEEIEALSRIIEELNEPCGLDPGPKHGVTPRQVMDKLDGTLRWGRPRGRTLLRTVQLTFDHRVDDAIEEILDTNFDLYKRGVGDQAFGKALKRLLIPRYRGRQLLTQTANAREV